MLFEIRLENDFRQFKFRLDCNMNVPIAQVCVGVILSHYILSKKGRVSDFDLKSQV